MGMVPSPGPQGSTENCWPRCGEGAAREACVGETRGPGGGGDTLVAMEAWVKDLDAQCGKEACFNEIRVK